MYVLESMDQRHTRASKNLFIWNEKGKGGGLLGEDWRQEESMQWKSSIQASPSQREPKLCTSLILMKASVFVGFFFWARRDLRNHVFHSLTVSRSDLTRRLGSGMQMSWEKRLFPRQRRPLLLQRGVFSARSDWILCNKRCGFWDFCPVVCRQQCALKLNPVMASLFHPPLS